MKQHCLLSFCFAWLTLSAVAGKNSGDKKSYKDSTGYHKLNVSFSWFEVGTSVPFKEKKLRELPYGMNTYLYGPKGGFAGGYFGIGFHYKDRWGISTIFNFQEYTVADGNFKNYISSQYPNHFLSTSVQAHTYTLYNINYRLSYRFHRGRFIYEPQFQFGMNDCNDFKTHFVLKEENSNQFTEYDIQIQNKRKNLISYRAALVVRWRYSRSDWKWNLEPGLRVDFMIIPTNFKYTITSTPYNEPATVHEVNVKQLRPAITITAVMSVFRK